MPTIRTDIECKSCGGSGLYQGCGDCKEVAVICRMCKGEGHYVHEFTYNEFAGRKLRKFIKRVYLTGHGYNLKSGVSRYGDIVVDMDKEGVSYDEFLEGKRPEHIRALGCPMLADPGACHSIKGFVDVCDSFNNIFVGYIPECKNSCHADECWKRFDSSYKQLQN